ncbi:MAG: hypothetical protein ACRC28_07450 [Clostridium sp.]|uniref:hypothetical protein n=1 Tax=Clostridium sp. TaxID=1506 RepID=UPI003F377DA7
MFKGKIFYYEDVLYILYEDEMEKLEKSSIFLGKNYSFHVDGERDVFLSDIITEVFFCSLDYGRNCVSFKVNEDGKGVLKNYKLRFGAFFLKEINYVTNSKGEIYDLCNFYDVKPNYTLIKLKDFEVKFIDEWSIGLLLKSDIFIKTLNKDDFIFEVDGKAREIAYIRKDDFNYFTMVFRERFTNNPRESLVLKTKNVIKGSIDALGRFIKEEEMVSIENKLKPRIRNIGLVQLSEEKISLSLNFDTDILRYSSNDFYVKVRGEKALAKGSSNFLRKGKPMILELEKTNGIDIEDVDIYVKTEGIKSFFTLGYNKSMIESFDFIKVEAFYGKRALLNSDIDSILNVSFNERLRKIEKIDIKYTVAKEEDRISLINEEYGKINFYYEGIVQNITRTTIDGTLESSENNLNIFFAGMILNEFKGFVYADYTTGNSIENERKIGGLKGVNTPIEYVENVEEVIYIESYDFGENWTLEGKRVTKPVIIEIDNSVSYRYYGNLENKTIFEAELKWIYIERDDGNLNVDVDIYNFECENLVIEIDKNININFKESIIKNMIKL